MPRFVYSTHAPRANRWRADDVTGHAFGYRSRRYVLVAGSPVEYQAYCSCKWRAKEWRGSLKMATLDHDKHVTIFIELNPTLF